MAFWSLACLSIMLLLAVLTAIVGWTPLGLSRLCATLLHRLPAARGAALACFLLLGVGGLGAGIARFVQQIIATRLLVRRLRRRPRASVPPMLRGVLGEIHLAGRLEVIADRDVYAFSVGFWRPRIVLSTGLRELLDPDELTAVLLHEAYHVRALDSLKVAFARAMARALFFLPLADDLARSYLIQKELAADRYAIRQMGDRWALASALWKLARQAQTQAQVAVAGATDAIALRVRQLLDSPEPVAVPVIRSRAGALVSATIIALLIGLLAAVVGPVSASTDCDTCQLHAAWDPRYTRSDHAAIWLRARHAPAALGWGGVM